MGFFGDTEYKWNELPASSSARSRLLSMGLGPAPDQPVQDVAGADPLEQWIYRMSQQRLMQPDTSAYDTAISGMKGIAAGGGDLTRNPEFQGIWNKVLQEGTTGGRNLQRALKLSGNAPTHSSKGLDMLGRQTTGVQEQLLGSALPFLESERNRQFSALGALPGLQQAREASQTGAMATAGNAAALMRAIEQATQDAAFQAQLRNLQYITQTQPGYLQSVLVTPQLTQEYKPGVLDYAKGVGQFVGEIGNIGAGTLGIMQGIGGLAM
jgi:hypothetical protein